MGGFLVFRGLQTSRVSLYKQGRLFNTFISYINRHIIGQFIKEKKHIHISLSLAQREITCKTFSAWFVHIDFGWQIYVLVYKLDTYVQPGMIKGIFNGQSLTVNEEKYKHLNIYLFFNISFTNIRRLLVLSTWIFYLPVFLKLHTGLVNWVLC